MENGTSKSEGTTALAKLLNQLNLPTLIAVLFMGGGNWFATHSSSESQREEIYRAIRQINDLHRSLDEFEDRQKGALEKGNQALANQSKLLENQNRMLDNQNKLLESQRK